VEHFGVTVYVTKLEPDSPMGKGYYWSVAQIGGADPDGWRREMPPPSGEAGVESTRLKAWRKALSVARRDFGPTS
jgi:hypothetical protein